MSGQPTLPSLRRAVEIRKQISELESESIVVYCHMNRLEMLKKRNLASESPSVTFDSECTEGIAKYEREIQELERLIEVQYQLLHSEV